MHFGGHSFSQIWHATQRIPASQSFASSGFLLSYTRKGNTRAASIGAMRSSGYSTVVIRSFETKLPAKFFAVSASPFRMPSPSNEILPKRLLAFFPRLQLHSSTPLNGSRLPLAFLFTANELEARG